ncbi:MAG: AAA family ATPase, partial [Acidobacteria bacterium]|nr:AAA family ATPase [Acidobacteriota bacterium]
DHMRAGIDCVAVTDHNSGAWVDGLRAALAALEHDKPDGYRPLHLFPGTEIAVQGGVHLLAILAKQATTSDIDTLLGAVGVNGGAKASSGGVTTRSFAETVEVIVRAGGIAIPAHVDRDNGLFQEFHGATLEQALRVGGVCAMETVDSRCEKPQLYRDMKLRWTEILGSDSHHPSGSPGQRFPGSCFSWVKMGTPDLDGLRLALLDGSLSVRRSDEHPVTPNVHAPTVLESIEVADARYIGRAAPFVARLNPWLNAIVGGRGTGKSSLVECVRIALRRQDELPDELKPEFEKYGDVHRTRDDGGLLTEGTAIRVVYRKERSRFRIQWSPTGTVSSIEEALDGKWARAEGDVVQRFPIRIYSQKQIFHLARTPRALLRIVDDATEVDLQSWRRRWRQEENRYLSLRLKVREIEAELPEETRLRGELDDVVRKLAIFEEAGHADVLRTFQRRRRQQRAIETWQGEWVGTGDRLREIGADVVPDDLDDTHMDSGSQADAPLLANADAVRGRLAGVRQQLEKMADEADRIAAGWRADLDGSTWKREADAAGAAYEALRARLATGGAGDPSAYGELVQRRQVIEQRLVTLTDRKREASALKAQAEASLARLRRIRRELTEARGSFLDRILADNPYVRIQVIPYGARDTVEAEFRHLIQRLDGRFEKDIGSPGGEGLLGRIYAASGGAAQMEDALRKEKQQIRSVAEGAGGTWMLADQRFAPHLRRLAPEALDRLDVWFPEDSLDVRYSTTGDGGNLRSIAEGSPGQKTAALLAFLLSYGEEPLVLDQPEDDLDNHLIHELIVRQIREVNRRRQIVVVTHNPNIVVNGDAELVLALAARGGATQVECNGSLQDREVRETICTIMEGGRDAFAERYRRIAVEGLGVRQP